MKNIEMLIRCKVIGNRSRIVKVILNFEDECINKITVEGFHESEGIKEVFVCIVVNGDSEIGIKVIKRLNEYLYEEELINHYGYMGVTTIPALFEVNCNE